VTKVNHLGSRQERARAEGRVVLKKVTENSQSLLKWHIGEEGAHVKCDELAVAEVQRAQPVHEIGRVPHKRVS
jgi:hypothetical protein